MLDSSQTFSRRLLDWYDKHQRKLPWRAPAGTSVRLDPYHVLVSEAMLQQTQVVTVIPYFERFLARFPTLENLANADPQDVLRLWQGLGYYSRARNLQKAAQHVIREFGGKMPSDVEGLLSLPGVGRYTAGAVASIAFGTRAPIVDGNVARVLCRIDLVKTNPRDRMTQALLWRRAEEILPDARLGDFNSALMELGATVCTPRSPCCLTCPVRDHCAAQAAGLQETIPLTRKTNPRRLHHRVTFCIRRGDEWLIEQRPEKGRWAGMWQFVTVEAPGKGGIGPLAKSLPLRVSKPKKLGTIQHGLTHRQYEFAAYICEADPANSSLNLSPRRWVSLAKLSDFPLPRPHLKIAEMLSAR